MSSLEELCERKEKIVQSKLMVIKFRDSNIERLEKALKKAGCEEDKTQEKEKHIVSNEKITILKIIMLIKVL